MLSLSKRGPWIAAMCIALTACVADNVSPTISNTPVESPESVETAISTSTIMSQPPTSTSSPSLTPTSSLPTPALPSSVQSDFLLGGNSPDCRLPCWNGLVIGQSDLEDIQQVFDDVFGFNGTYNLSPEPSEVTEGLAFVNYEWDTSGGNWEDLYVVFWLEGDSYTLQGIRFRWSGDIVYGTQITLRSILRELGPPSHLLMILEGSQGFSARYDVSVVYEEQGIVFRLWGGLPAEVVIRPDNSVEASTELCLEERFSRGVIYIMEPLENELHDVSHWESLIDSVLNADYFRPSEDVIGLSPEELTALAMQDEDVCITVEVEP